MGKIVSLRFYEELNAYLPPALRKRTFDHQAPSGATAGALIAMVGVPLANVDLILVNGVSADFTQPLRDGDRVSVYPVFEAVDVAPVTRLPGRPLRHPRFAVDTALTELARALAAHGYPVVLGGDEEALSAFARRGWIVIIAERGHAEPAVAGRTLRVTGDAAGNQLRAIAERLQLRLDD